MSSVSRLILRFVVVFLVVSSLGCASHRTIAEERSARPDASLYRLISIPEDPTGFSCGWVMRVVEEDGAWNADVLNRSIDDLYGGFDGESFVLRNADLELNGRRQTDGSIEGQISGRAASNDFDGEFRLERMTPTQVEGWSRASAISTLRTLTTVNEQYRVRYGEYAPSIAALAEGGYLESGQFAPIDATSTRDGYRFEYGRSDAGSWWARAHPDDAGPYFYADQTGMIRFADDASVSAFSEPVR